MPRPSNTDERRKQITRGLMGVMAKKGYDGASVADIAKAARLTPGLVHYHFKDKLEILTALAGHLSEDNIAALRQHLGAASAGPTQAIDAIIDFYLGLGATAKPDVLACWIALSGEALRHKAVGKVFEATLADIHHVVKEQVEEGIRRKAFASNIDAEAVAAALVAAIQGYFVLAGTARALIPKGSAARTVKQMMQGVLGAKP
jgi:TetR/AcrR family transcriptional repressor of bet genes